MGRAVFFQDAAYLRSRADWEGSKPGPGPGPGSQAQVHGPHGLKLAHIGIFVLRNWFSWTGLQTYLKVPVPGVGTSSHNVRNVLEKYNIVSSRTLLFEVAH